MKIDAVFEGGGIKGLAYLGAIEVMEDAGYQWNQLAGTSAGSIVATLLAVGYSGNELFNQFSTFPYETLKKKTRLSQLPYIGPWLSLWFYNGLYKMTPLEEWMNDALKEKGIYQFGDLPDNKLKIIITDISKNRMTILPDDLPRYGIDPSTFPLALAVRMSSSIPFFFLPGNLNGNTILDGGLLSNYPIWIFDSKEKPRWPTFGFRLSGPSVVTQPQEIKGTIDFTLGLVRTMIEAHDKRYIENHDAARTIFIKDISVGATEFNLTLKDKTHLIELGRESARKFLNNWDFNEYLNVYHNSTKVNTRHMKVVIHNRKDNERTKNNKNRRP